MNASPRAALRPKRKPSTLTGYQVMFASILSIGLILAINFSSRISAGQPLQDAYQRVQTEIETLRRQQADLITERDYVRSDLYVESWARSDGKMARAGEVLVIPVPARIGSDAAAQAAPLVIETPVPRQETWLLWWSLFFDGEPPLDREPLPF